MRVLGIDPGLVRTGWAVVEPVGRRVVVLGHGVITPPTGDELPARLAEGARQLRLVVAEHQPRWSRSKRSSPRRAIRAAPC